MKTKLLAIALVLLTGCGPMGKPERSFVQCTVDDSLSYTAEHVSKASVSNGGVLTVYRKGDRPTTARMLLPGETCELVTAIQWELAQ